MNKANRGGPIAPVATSPFFLENGEAYARWRDAKLAAYPNRVAELAVEVSDPRRLTDVEVEKMRRVCRKANMAVYTSRLGALEAKSAARELGRRFGLERLDRNLLVDEDGITSLHVVAGKCRRGYIPYSNRRLLWHTDGYYNPPGRQIGAFLLHCVRPAAEGGENELLDHEIVYILLRDANPAYVRALMAPDAMTIPANAEEGAVYRPAQTGPVFSVDGAGNLHMRYTARTRSVEWKTDLLTQEAVRFLEGLLAQDLPHVFRWRLASGQGVLCNNVLHRRTGFTDGVDKSAARLIYRARYYDRIVGTGFSDIYA